MLLLLLLSGFPSSVVRFVRTLYGFVLLQPIVAVVVIVSFAPFACAWVDPSMNFIFYVAF